VKHKNESVKILMSMTGIDYFSAMMIASEIGDITRFSTPEKLVSWSGLCPSIHQSGNSLYMGRMEDGRHERKMDTNSGSKHSGKKRR
jgi:transposase